MIHFTKVAGCLIQLEQPEIYHRMREEDERPGACRVFVWVLAVACMFLAAIAIWCMTK